LTWGWHAAGLAQEPAVNAPRRALALTYSGREAEASSLLGQVMEQRGIGPDEDGNVATTDLMPLLETAVLLRDAEKAAILYRRLEGVSALVKVHGGTQTSVGRLLGDAALLLDRPDVAKTHYETALEVCDKIGFRPETALLHLALAELCLKHYPDETANATSHLDFATRELSEMGMKPSLERALRLRGQRKVAVTYPDGLTAREFEVLRLLAQGKSNQQIAAELDISLHTAGHHVGSILGKVGAANRTEAASYAFQHGLGISPT
jgi:DNA-binding CsgD family transcriptional regulator